jgi:hypothetical protein
MGERSVRRVVIASLLFCAGTAHAGRETDVSVLAGGSIDGPAATTDWGDLSYAPVVAGSLVWARALPPIPGPNQLDGRADAAPEVTAMAYHGEAMLLAGLRLDVASAGNNQGMFHTTGAAEAWLSPRVGVSTQADTPVVGFDLGFAFTHGSRWRLGIEEAFYTWKQHDAAPCECFAFDAAPDAPPVRRFLQFQLGLVVAGAL